MTSIAFQLNYLLTELETTMFKNNRYGLLLNYEEFRVLTIYFYYQKKKKNPRLMYPNFKSTKLWIG